MPSGHGIVGNGWYFRDLAQVWFWRQANQLVQGEKVWESARRRDPSCTCAKMFWWYNMYSSADWSVTPRPIYRSDGGKIFDIYSQPSDLRDRLTAELGAFPFFSFWGPKADLASSALDRRSARCASIAGSRRRCCWSTCRTSTTTSSAWARTTRGSAPRSARSTRSAGASSRTAVSADGG